MSLDTESNLDILIEFKKDTLKSLLNLLKNELPHKIRQYNFLLSYLYHYDKLNQNRDKLISDRWNVRFYGHRYGQLENCTIVTINGSKDFVITAFTLEKSRTELKECLRKTKLINWETKSLNIMCDESVFKAVNEVVCEKDTNWTYLPLENVLHISKEKIRQLSTDSNLPEDLYLAPLDPEKHAKIMDDHWDYKAENSLQLIRQSIELNGGIGIFRQGVEQPICWISTNEFLTPGFLHTLPAERKKGYAALIMKMELKRLLSIHNTDLFSFVCIENTPSLALHYKLGFETVNRVTWIQKCN
ncbi:uncharacterized protein LOC119602020 [Lucilia sericata]|uniref:uncharacterized protein LOC119602020 n=1 Tax=Lucilia sericata TaxID=13632 RepID=UPI0018A84381|nr:uncharacterized protein LOC119602020 [Lucilia sericata]